MELHKETCFTCAKYSNLHISKEEFCVHSHTMCQYPHPVPCVHYKRFPEYERIEHDNHSWKRSSTEFAHMNGVSWLGWCTKCGAEGGPGGAEHRCYDIVITKEYKTGGEYQKSYSKEQLKQHAL